MQCDVNQLYANRSWKDRGVDVEQLLLPGKQLLVLDPRLALIHVLGHFDLVPTPHVFQKSFVSVRRHAVLTRILEKGDHVDAVLPSEGVDAKYLVDHEGTKGQRQRDEHGQNRSSDDEEVAPKAQKALPDEEEDPAHSFSPRPS